MKKKRFILFALVLVIAAGAAAVISTRPYKPVSFVVDGDNWSATVADGSSVLLELNNQNSKEWSITSEPETFVSDYHNISENVSEFHITALNDGTGEMVFECTKDDGTTDRYVLVLSISRHRKTHLQIDTVSFKKSE